MIEFKDIKDVHLEISTLCNATCPLCPRNLNGYPHNNGYPEVNLTLNMARKIFDANFLQQLTSLRINGNYGDIVMNPEAVDIIEYFRQSNSNLKITVSTNGSARNKDFWKKLAELKVQVSFCIDGLEDTHSLYRQNTSWDTIIKNARTFIESGGYAIWKFIIFDHNKHQIEQCRELANELKFILFQTVNHGRNTGPVFNKYGKLTHTLGKYTGTGNFIEIYTKKKKDMILLEDITSQKTPKNNIICKTQNDKSIYITANGEVYPCCWTGFFPRTYGRGDYHQPVNAQLIPLLDLNNATERPLKDCIDWFNNIKNSWSIPDYNQGRLVVCDDECGSN